MAQDRDTLLDSIRDGMEVVDKAGTRIGTVTRVEGGHFKILRPGQEPRNAHQMRHLVPAPLTRPCSPQALRLMMVDGGRPSHSLFALASAS